ncbi:MAG: hypothetical protein WC152_02830 [Candidatus Izemoplasmatales bacterium]
MSSQSIKSHIHTSLTGEAVKNAIDLVVYFESQGMQFELSTTDYLRDKQYWYVKYQNEFIGFILFNGHNPVKDETEPEGWVFWSDNYNSSAFADFPLEESIKGVAYKHVDIGTCGGGLTVNLFGQVFTPVCNGTTFRFDNPNSEEIVALKKLVDIRKHDISRDH